MWLLPIVLNLRSALPELHQLPRFSCTLLDQIPVYWLSQRGYPTAGYSKLDLPMCKQFRVRIKTRIAPFVPATPLLLFLKIT